MAYTSQDKILATHYNSFVADVNELYADVHPGGTGEGVGGYGYGQGALPVVSINDPVTSVEWNALLGTVHNCADHQGTILNIPTSVAPGDKIYALDGTTGIVGFTTANLAAAITSVRANRFNVGAGIGAVTGATTTSATGNWDATRTQTITASFASWDQARYFFNASGKIRFSFSFDGVPNNTTETNWVAMSGGIGVVSFGYTGTSSSGGVGLPGGGFYDLTTVNQQVYSYIPAGYSSEQYIVQARLNATPGSATQIIFTLSFVTPAGGDIIDLQLNSELALFNPNDVANNIVITAPTLSPSAIS